MLGCILQHNFVYKNSTIPSSRHALNYSFVNTVLYKLQIYIYIYILALRLLYTLNTKFVYKKVNNLEYCFFHGAINE